MDYEKDLQSTFRVHVKNDDLLVIDFLKAVTNDDDNTRRAELVAEAVYSILKGDAGRSYNMLVNMVPMEKESYISKKANEIYRRIAKEKQLRRIAILGDPNIHSKVVKYVAPFARVFTKVAWVTSEQEATTWLED